MIRKYFAELLGTALLLATIVGSGIMAETLADGNIGLALLCNGIATGAILYMLITVLGPVSGAHFNPVVTAVMAYRKELPAELVPGYVVCQVLGAVAGVWLAHLMFDQSVFQVSGKIRWGTGQWIAEAIATFGLLLTILGCLKSNLSAIPASVALYITAAYWFTASTSFANPAVTLARALTDTFAGIAPSNVLPFVLAQVIGASAATILTPRLFDTPE